MGALVHHMAETWTNSVRGTFSQIICWRPTFGVGVGTLYLRSGIICQCLRASLRTRVLVGHKKMTVVVNGGRGNEWIILLFYLLFSHCLLIKIGRSFFCVKLIWSEWLYKLPLWTITFLCIRTLDFCLSLWIMDLEK